MNVWIERFYWPLCKTGLAFYFSFLAYFYIDWYPNITCFVNIFIVRPKATFATLETSSQEAGETGLKQGRFLLWVFIFNFLLYFLIYYANDVSKKFFGVFKIFMG